MTDESKALGLVAAKTALVLIDLQKPVVALPVTPHSAALVVQNSAALADRCRALGIAVVLVTVGFRPDGSDALKVPTDAPPRTPPAGTDSGIVPELKASSADILVTKHQWGAFYGTDLDLQLRRRGIDTIILGGVATNFGVESTGRDAWERNYKIVFVEDAMSSLAPEAHDFAIRLIFPRIGRVRSTAQVLDALSSD